MKQVSTITALRDAITQWSQSGERIVFVPTMGNLHAGHMRLVDVAHEHGTRVVVSVFVNPLQFSAGSDYETYPRTLAEDAEKLRNQGTDLLFTPSAEELYGAENESLTTVKVDELSNILCGIFRAGHFEGVTTIVAKLFNLVQPDVAVFGEKDFQQLVVIRKMVKDLCFPVQVVGVPTVREAGDLAMSSRNGYLNDEQRQQAGMLYKTLMAVKQKVETGEQSFAGIEAWAMDALQASGFRPDYISIVEPDALQPGQLQFPHLRVLAAAWLGEARLIDNIVIR